MDAVEPIIDETLARALRFDAADLAANQQGLIGPGQFRNLRRDAGLKLLILMLLLPAIAVTAYVPESRLWLLALGVIVAVAALLGPVFRLDWSLPALAALYQSYEGYRQSHPVWSLAGVVDVAVDRGRLRPQMQVAIATADGVRVIPLPRHVVLGLQNAVAYRLYFVGRLLPRLVAVAAIDDRLPAQGNSQN